MPELKDLSQRDLWTLRALVQRTGWGSFMRHVGSLMAEQADKVKWESPQGVALANCSRTIHALDKFFKECETFDYLSWGPEWIDQQHLDMMKEIIDA